ncbi:hypothetical protein NQ176_g8701 [Zarea fungicola]|uniref:Uncharacterized protein n=1 Tax=Zarea fungicola TaxID=93591 RepID=A0ACC1MSN8_9HYPO|nr:hypothetical protein NQ176_g8701 [Lecanicillium fungicola]
MKIKRLFIYPVKSLLPVEVSYAEITPEGLRFDRQYILIKSPENSSGPILEHLTIKTNYLLGLFQPAITDDWTTLTIRHTLVQPESSIRLSLTPSPLSCLQSKEYKVNIFGTEAAGIDMGDEPANFFGSHLGIPVRLLFIAGSGHREIPGAPFIPRHLMSLSIRPHETRQPQRIRFADAAPLLITSCKSEQEARSRLPSANQGEDVIILFRPNVHIDVDPDSQPFEEDNWKELLVYSQDASVEKAVIRCIFKTPRCVSLNVDLKTGRRAPRDQQMYGLLAPDRRVNNAFPHKPVFGQYACAAPNGAILRVGDVVQVTEQENST